MKRYNSVKALRSRRVPDNLKLRIPVNFNPDTIIPYNLRSDARERITNQMNYILDHLIPDVLSKRREEELEEYGFVTLNATLLKEILGSSYIEAVHYLEQANVIEINHSYRTDTYSKGYTLTNHYSNQKLREVVVTNRTIRKRYAVFLEQKREDQEKRLSSIPHLTKWLKPELIQIDIEGAQGFITQYEQKMLDKFNQRMFRSEEKRRMWLKRINDRINYMKRVVESIQKGVIQIHRDDAGRLYTPITSLNSELRRFLKVNDQPLGAVDIKSSQPYLLQVLLDVSFWDNKRDHSVTLFKAYRTGYDKLGTKGRDEIVRLLRTQGLESGRLVDGKSFKAIRWWEDFYTYLMRTADSYAEMGVKGSFSDRAKTKKTVMVLLYDRFDKHAPGYYQFFKQLYPYEVEFMDVVKRQDKSLLAKILQGVEATIVLEMVCKRLAKVYPNMPLITVHDSIMSTPEYLSIIERELGGCLEEITGVKPGLKSENMILGSEALILEELVAKDWKKVKKLLTTRRTQRRIRRRKDR